MHALLICASVATLRFGTDATAANKTTASPCSGVVEMSNVDSRADVLVGCAGGEAELAPVQTPWSLPGNNLVLSLLAGCVAAAGITYVRRNERWRRQRSAPSTAFDGTPYIAGGALGIVIVGSLIAFGRPVGASGAFQNLAALAGRRLMPANTYWPLIAAGLTWQVWVIVGVVAGAFMGSFANGRFSLRLSPESGWVEDFGPNTVKRWLLAFLGAALIEVASAIAGGCTSGLALSGGIVLAPAAFLFMAAMFATGIPTALWVGRRSKGRR